MTNLPFGFGPPDRDDSGDSGDPGPGGSGSGAFGAGALGAGGFGLPEELAGKVPLFAELQKLFSWSGGPVNWDLARQVAISAVGGAGGGVGAVSAGERADVVEAVRLADLWLDDVTELPSGVTSVEAWNRVEWIERTLPVWSALCDPVAEHVVTAMSAGLPEEVRAQAGPMAPIMAQLGGMMFGSQVGQALGALASEVLSATDIGLPLGPAGTAALLPDNIAGFGAGLGRPDAEVRLYLGLREAAHQRLFAHVPWLRQRLIDTVDGYARGIEIDASGIERMMSEIDPSDPMSIQSALTGGMFEPKETPSQQAALRRLETLLALVEGWVDAVVADVAGTRLGGADSLREASRRRRAGGGPAEQTFATLVGLELRPRKLREASALWSLAAESSGAAGRDALWAHPDLLPDSEDLDDPAGFLARRDAVSDDALNSLLDDDPAPAALDSGGAGPAAGDGGGASPADDDTAPLVAEDAPRDDAGQDATEDAGQPGIDTDGPPARREDHPEDREPGGSSPA
ncbi:MAG: zinc-dependent metalloprotease [bacterium]